jgi:transposase-like protein
MKITDHIGIFEKGLPLNVCEAVIQSFNLWEGQREFIAEAFKDGENQFKDGNFSRSDTQLCLEAVDLDLYRTLNGFIKKVNLKGKKEVLGLYLSESEGANFWLQVLTDLNNRGVKDILIASVDGLKGFPQAINSIFPKTEVQLCIIHQVRNSLKYVASKNKKEFMKDLKKVYQAVNKEQAEMELDNLENKWGDKYPIVIKSWRNKWDNLSNYFKYPQDIRKVIYTTNIIESVHRQFRKLTKTKGGFPNENSLLKLLYMGIQNTQKIDYAD